MAKCYFISDLHFGHKNCLAYDNRPFKNIDEHDKAIIERWNNAVGIDDAVWILGDISWYNATKTIKIFKQLNGIKHLCRGNHDSKLLRNRQIQELFVEICDYKELQLGQYGIVLCHYPIPCYNNHYYGWYHLYGHVHMSFEWNMMERNQFEMTALYDKKSNMYNIGCMLTYMNYTPKTLEQIVESYNKTLLDKFDEFTRQNNYSVNINKMYKFEL